MPLSIVTPPIAEPLTWSQAQKHLRQDGLDDDQVFVETILIPAARDRAELATRRAMLTQTWDYVLDEFPRGGYIEIPKPPLVSVTYVQYVDMAGVTQTWGASNYLVQAPAGPRCQRGRVSLPFAAVWPIVLPQAGAITVRFICGYGSSGADLPPMLVVAQLQDVGTLYESREAIVVDDKRVSSIEVPGFSREIYKKFRSNVVQRVRES